MKKYFIIKPNTEWLTWNGRSLLDDTPNRWIWEYETVGTVLGVGPPGYINMITQSGAVGAFNNDGLVEISESEYRRMADE